MEETRMKTERDKNLENLEKSREPLKCVWMSAGVVGYKLCDMEFRCDECPFDRALQRDRATFRGRAAAALEGIDRHGFLLSRSLFYHPAHIWARVEGGGAVRVGLDDFGQKLFGRVDRVLLPDVGVP